MARLNVKKIHPHGFTHEGAPAAPMTPIQALRRSVMACLLWEREFYEEGEDIADRIVRLATQVPVEELASLAIEAREQGNLRHVPLLLLSVLAKRHNKDELHYGLVANTIARVVQRADELTELLAVHAKLNGVTPGAVKKTIPAQMKKGLARAFAKFDEYQLAKYDRAGAIRLRDALFLVHAKPKDEVQAALWKRLVDNELKVPDTWEVALSSGADMKETFERLLREGKLGYLALLRNLRNMVKVGVDNFLVEEALHARKGAQRVLPVRYVAAARAAPSLEPHIDAALCAAIGELPVLPGKTVVLVDVSGSMDCQLSGRSDLTRMDAAAALGAIVHGDLRLFTFSNRLVEIPPRRGMAGVDAIVTSQPHRGTLLGDAVEAVNATIPHDRLIVITDEQAASSVPAPAAKHAYMINVASAKNGIGYGCWVHIDGFSEGVLKFIHACEAEGVWGG